MAKGWIRRKKGSALYCCGYPVSALARPAPRLRSFTWLLELTTANRYRLSQWPLTPGSSPCKTFAKPPDDRGRAFGLPFDFEVDADDRLAGEPIDGLLSDR